VEMIDGMIKKVNQELGEPAHAVATGGLAKVVITRLSMVTIIEPFLTLEGLKIIFERVAKGGH
jgi:type III pantothenate kinase